MKIKTLAMTLAVSTALTGAAHAAVITKSYEVTSVFTQGPLGKVVTSFDLTFDPSATASSTPVFGNYRSNGGLSFTDPVITYNFEPSYNDGFADLPESRYILIGGGDAGLITADSYDFIISFTIDDTGAALSAYSTYAAKFDRIASGPTTVRDITAPLVNIPSTSSTPAAAVPEPATWAMMLVGFGMIGGAARYRRKARTVSFA